MTQPLLSIDLDAVAVNWKRLDRQSGAAETGAAVKANAYGCGAEQVTRTLLSSGCRSFFVATPEEALALRALFPEPTIYAMNGTERAGAKALRAARIVPCLNTPEQIRGWVETGGGPWALQTDTGMSRLGLSPPEIAGLATAGPPEAVRAECCLIMSHLACADTAPNAETDAQRGAFLAQTIALREVLPNARCSLSATGGTLLGGGFHFDLVRCGIGLYGGLPFTDAVPVVSLTAPILQLRDLEPGAFVGYGASWRPTRPSRIATLPLGYADGFVRALSNRAQVFLGGVALPVRGRVSMDLITVDVTGHPDAQVGAAVEILGPHQGVDALAEAADTIGYEILTRLGSRYARRYNSTA